MLTFTFLILFLLKLSIVQHYEQKFNQIHKILNASLNCNSTKSGYKCTASSNFNQNFCKTRSEICPTDWGCIDLHMGFLCRPHDTATFGLQHKPWHGSIRRQKRAESMYQCDKILCQNGALCKNGQCKCLKHYMGKYCSEEINYCTKNLCKHNSKCIPRVGGFTCECDQYLAGKYCQTSVQRGVCNMKRPNFIYEPLQYAGFKYYYVFHTEGLGFEPGTEVNFGDGTIVKRKYLKIHLKNAYETLIKYFSPPLNIKSDKLEVYAFTHIYQTPKIYTLKVRAWNKYQEVYNTDYEVQVVAVGKCSLDVTLHNAAINGTVLNLYRQNTINFMSAAWSNCMHMKLEYQWNVHKVQSFDESLSNDNVYDIKENYVELQNPNLAIPPFTLDYGNYTIVLCVHMLKPKPGIKQKLATRLTINRRPIIAHIQGGMKISINIRSMFYLDAAASYDPNYGKSKQPPMTFTWVCLPPSDFCKGFQALDVKGPILIVPPNGITSSLYRFKVWVNNYKDTEITEYTGNAEQEVLGMDSVVPFYAIRCLRNCLGGRANNMYTIALRGIMTATLREQNDTVKNWVVYPHPEINEQFVMQLDNTEYTEKNSVIIVYEQLESGESYKFLFSGYNEKTNDLSTRNVSFAEFFITTYKPPKNGSCSVYPMEGYAMLTTFSLTCSGFADIESLTLLYEVIQFVNMEDRASSGALVAYGYTNTINNITLSPGFRKNDYITTLHVTATDINGLSTFVEIGVTVFPLIYYLKNPNDVVMRFIHVGSGLKSPLHVLLAGGNHFELVQQISSTCFSLDHLLQSEEALYVDVTYIELLVEQVRDILMSYLYQVPISTLQSIKHIATALDKVINLPSKTNIWRASTVTGLDIMKNLIQQLEDRFNVYDEEIFQNDMDDIGIVFMSIASDILKTPTADSHVLQEGDTDSESNRLIRNKYIQEINPFNIDAETLANHHSSDAMDVIDRFMRLYMTYKLPNERTTLFTSSDVSLIMKKAAPEHLTTKSLSLSNTVALNLLFDKTLFHKNAFCNLEMFIVNDNPNWYEDKDTTGLHFPFIKINLTNDVDGSPIDADMVIHVRPTRTMKLEVYNASAPIRLFWQINEKHIQVHRIIVPKGGKLLIKFLPIQGNHKLKVVIKKEMRPRMIDFWRNGINIPQIVPEGARDQGLSVFVDDEVTEDNTFYYLGVLPHIDTLKELMKEVEEPILPHAFHYDDEMNDERDMPEYYETTTKINRDAEEADFSNVQYIKYETVPKTVYNNQTLPYAFSAHSIRCITWNETSKHWKSTCNVRASTSSSRVTCNCTGHNPITVSFQNVPVRYQEYTNLKYFLKYSDNPLIPFVVIFSLILFIGLFKWAASEDRKDRLRRTVCFLVDNYPQCEYCYLVFVRTGRKMKSGTTSKVTIELEGTNATSLPHVLTDWTRSVMERGGQDWFVLKTMKPLGEIYCMHIWTDYSGSRPSWYCSKITIHDVQEQQVWFFIVDKWFDPISGDGTMAYTIYQSMEEKIFSTSYQLKENVIREFESGMHGWLSIFYKHPYSNYTRKQRVGVAYTHMVLIMMVLIFLNELPVADSPQHQIYKTGSYQLEIRDLVLSCYAILIAFPIHSVLLWLFRCVRPSSQWTESKLDRNLSRFNMDHNASEDIVWIDPETKEHPGKIYVTNRPQPKKVSFYNDFFEPEGDRTLRSKVSLQKLERDAGSDKVVPLRARTSNIETEEASNISAAPEVISSIYGREVVAHSYCFPPCCVVIVWMLLFFISVPCVYIVSVYGISYGWVMCLHYLTSFVLAIILSILVLEPLKLLFCGVYLFFYNRRTYSVEDRSDIVAALDSEYQVPAHLRNHVINKINKLRKSHMYMPINEERVLKLKRNRVVTFLMRMIIADNMLLMLFMLLFVTMIFNVFDPCAYLHHQDVMELLGNSKTSRMTDVNTQADLVDYLKNTIIANLQHFDNVARDVVTPLNPAVDEVSFLVGVIRLRQIRKSPSACRYVNVKRWAARCVMEFDDRNYTERWKPLTQEYATMKQPWLYHRPEQKFSGFFMRRNETRYPAGWYVAFLGRSKQNSVMKLEYLAKNDWFDYLTTVVYIDFVLYNLNRHQLSTVTLMAERTEQGVYYVYNDIRNVKMHPAEVYAQLYILFLLLVLFVVLIWYIHKESRKYTLLQPKQVFSNKWNSMKKFLLILGIINVVVYTKKILEFEYYTEKISHAAFEQYIDFDALVFWDDCLFILVAFMQFFVILEICDLFRRFYRVNLALTIVYKSRTADFFFFLVLLIIAFTWSGVALFGRVSYNFQDFREGFFTVVTFTHRHFKMGELGNSESVFLTFLYCLAVVVAFFFIFRWLLATILIHSYSMQKRSAHFEPYLPILSNYTKKYFDSIDSSPNRKPLKLGLYLQSIEPRMHAIGHLFVNFYYRKKGKELREQRQLAMDAIAFGVIRKKKKHERESHSFVMEKYQRKEQARALATNIIIRNALKSKLEYLTAKIDIQIREARYVMLKKVG